MIARWEIDLSPGMETVPDRDPPGEMEYVLLMEIEDEL
jgi:hypothetical protein